jgi:hypothetical protein
MNSKWFKPGIVILVVAVLAVGAVVTFAQGGPGGHMGGQGNSLLAVAAEVIGIDQTELVAALESGQTIAEVAEANDVAVEDIVDAFVTPHTEWLASAVEAGRLTQEQADLMTANMRAHLTLRLSEPFEQYGMGFMGGHGMGGGMHNGMGGGRHHGMGQGWDMGPGMGFNDSDGDGFCDNCPFNPESGV